MLPHDERKAIEGSTGTRDGRAISTDRRLMT